jgi:hypothetical protein
VGAVYAAGVVLTYLVPSPIGTNVERLALLFSPAVLLAVLLVTPRRPRYRRSGLALVLPSARPEHYARAEARLVRSRPAWLEPV